MKDRRRAAIDATKGSSVARGAARGDSGGRRHRSAADPAALGHRSGRRSCRSMASRCARPAGVGENLQDHLQIRCAYKVAGREDAERALPEPVQQGQDRARVCGRRVGTDDHGAVAARRLHAVRSDPRDAQHPVPRAAADAAEVRRTAGSVPGLHGERRQPAPDEPRLGAASPRPIRPRIPTSGRTISRPRTTGASPPKRPRDAAHRLDAGAAEV